jgi:hypothetical protein
LKRNPQTGAENRDSHERIDPMLPLKCWNGGHRFLHCIVYCDLSLSARKPRAVEKFLQGGHKLLYWIVLQK